IGDCTFEVAVQVLEMQRLQMMQSPMAGSVKRAVKVLPSLLVSVLIASARVTVRGVPLGTVSMVRARGAGVGADGVGAAAGAQREPGTLGGYDIRKPISEIVAEVPEIRRYAQVETTQFANIPSAYITPDQWLQLARNVNSVFEKRPEIAGIVVTHGTDRLEETAFFLHLTVKSEKPVVIVGAQRPATGI